MSTPVPTNPNPFTDPNNALRQFNQYFGNLRKQYGEDAIRQVGFTTKEFQDLQASLRKLQVDPRATPEQHREAYMKARDTLARRLTTPLEATRSYSVVQQPKPAPSSSVGNDGIVTPMPVESPVMNSPTQEQLYSYARAVGRGETGLWDPTRGVFVMTAQPPQPQQGGLTQAQQPVMPTPPPMPQPPEREVIGQRSPIPGVHGGDTRIFAPTTQPPEEIVVTGQRMPEPPRMSQPVVAPPPPPPTPTPTPTRTYYDPEGPVMPPMPVAPVTPMPYNPINTTRLEDLRPGSGMGIGGILNALRNMQLPQGVGGMPRQGSPNALTIGRGPVPLDQQGPPLGGGIGAFLGRQGEAPQGGGMPPGVGMLRDQMAAMLNPQPRQGSFVDTMPKAIVDDNFRFGETTQQAPQNAQAMAMGGLLRKYYGGGMC